MKLKIVFLLIACFFAFADAFSQEQPGLREKADKLYNQYQYANAAGLYKKLAEKKKPLYKDMAKLADCYRKMNELESAEIWYSQLVKDVKSTKEDLLEYADVLKANAKYAEAKKAFESYIQKSGDYKKAAVEVEGCDSALVWLSKPGLYKIKNEAAVNTALSEFSVFPLKNSVYYTGEQDTLSKNSHYGWTGNPYLKIFSANILATSSLSLPAITEGAYHQEPYHVGPVISNKASTTLYITRTYPGKDGEISKNQHQKYNTRNLELYLYHVDKTTGKWTKEAFKYNNVQSYSVGHAALSADEKIIYFVSDMAGGQGGTDIWFCELQADGSWAAPQNAGSTINTEGNEFFPTVMADGALYFSSNGLPGMGGLDIYKAIGNKSNWTKPLNLKYPVNSSRDDFSFFVKGDASTEEGSWGYLSSNRIGGKGGDDIYSFINQPAKIIFAVKATTLNKKTNTVLPNVSVSLFGNKRASKGNQRSNADGIVYFELGKETIYRVVARMEKYLADSVVISTKGLKVSDTLDVALHLEPLLEKGKVIRLDNLYYDLDKDNIREDAALILNELELTMRENPTLKIELSSHTDSRGKDAYNLALSKRRAQSAVNYLIGRGIAANRMIAKGYGETRPVNKCVNAVECSDDEHQANRRTEFTILSY